MNKLYLFRGNFRTQKQFERLQRNLTKSGIEYEVEEHTTVVPVSVIRELLEHAEYGFKDIIQERSNILKKFEYFSTEEMIAHLSKHPNIMRTFLFIGTYNGWFKTMLDSRSKDDDYSIFIPRSERGFVGDGTFRTGYFGLRW